MPIACANLYVPGFYIDGYLCCIIQCCPSVPWLGGRKGIRPVKTEWWGAGVVICPERGADLHMAQLMPLPLTVSCFSKIQTGLPFWYRLTRVVPEKGPLNGCVCIQCCPAWQLVSCMIDCDCCVCRQLMNVDYYYYYCQQKTQVETRTELNFLRPTPHKIGHFRDVSPLKK